MSAAIFLAILLAANALGMPIAIALLFAGIAAYWGVIVLLGDLVQ